MCCGGQAIPPLDGPLTASTTFGARCTSVPSAAGAQAAPEEEEWAANPWQAQADAHMIHLQQAGAFAPRVPGEGTGGFLGVGSGMAFGAPAFLCSLAVPAQSAEELARQVRDLEGQVAVLEETLASRQRELEEARFAPPPRGARSTCPSSSGAGPAVEEIERKNEFLSVLVARFERKTMALEEELAVLTLAKRDAEAQVQAGACAGPPKLTTNSAAQTPEDLLARRAEELEDLAANLEELLAGRDAELAEARARLADAEAQARSARECGRASAALEAEVEQLRQRNGFLTGLVARFEQKTMDLEGRLAALTSARRAAAAHAEEATAELRAELREAQSVAAEGQEAVLAVRERLGEQREASEGAAVALRDLKRDHNRKIQEVLRHAQALERRNGELEAESWRLEAAAQAAAASAAEAEAAAAVAVAQGPLPPPPKGAAAAAAPRELAELRELNAQLVRRLTEERAEHTRTRLCLVDASQDNELLSARLGRLTEQLCDLVELNDDLRQQLANGTAEAGLPAKSDGSECP
mmetsp:Transcript_13407/g.37063  ORF Transcript_13407/g.37063 Transcript_13407/m.37063 type:complete len:527 (-) Transcript_13407:99-1679(-)